MSTPKHYHAWVPMFGGKGLRMMAAKLTKEGIRREQRRGSRRTTRRWWRTANAARKALETAGVKGHVRECDLGDDCPEAAHVRSN